VRKQRSQNHSHDSYELEGFDGPVGLSRTSDHKKKALQSRSFMAPPCACNI